MSSIKTLCKTLRIKTFTILLIIIIKITKLLDVREMSSLSLRSRRLITQLIKKDLRRGSAAKELTINTEIKFFLSIKMTTLDIL